MLDTTNSTSQTLAQVKPEIFIPLSERFSEERKFRSVPLVLFRSSLIYCHYRRLEYFRDKEIVSVRWLTNTHEGYKPLVDSLITFAQRNIGFGCETNADVRFTEGHHSGTTAIPDFGFGKKAIDSTTDMEYIVVLESGYSQSAEKLRERARMWPTLPTVICVITVDFHTKPFRVPRSKPDRQIIPLSRVAFGKQVTSALDVIKTGSEIWAHPISRIELTLYLQQSGASVCYSFVS